jgi:hypothetical protein
VLIRRLILSHVCLIIHFNFNVLRVIEKVFPIQTIFADLKKVFSSVGGDKQDVQYAANQVNKHATQALCAAICPYCRINSVVNSHIKEGTSRDICVLTPTFSPLMVALASS